MHHSCLMCVKLAGSLCECVCYTDVVCRGSGREKHLPRQSDFQVQLSPGEAAC